MSSDPPAPVSEETWRNRFILLNLTRIGGTIVVLVGLLIWYGDIYRDGGAMEIGLPLALIGLDISYWGPTRLAQKWKTPPA